MTIAALYVDARGPYPSMPDVETWDEARDARRYAGPWPIVAHPACGPWGCLAHQYRGSEGGSELGVLAVTQVRQWGGVLEHPAHSRLWIACGLPRPGDGYDAHGGYSIATAQVEWGHVARKKTWLYLVGVPTWLVRTYGPPFPGRAPTHWISGGLSAKHKGGRRPAGIKSCSAQQRRRTPPLFAQYLLTLAASTRWR